MKELGSMGKKRVFLTGASGTIGGSILEALQLSGLYKVDCLVRRTEAASWVSALGGCAIFGDMTENDLRSRIEPAREYDFIIHAAQEHYSTHSDTEIHAADRAAVESLQHLCSDRTDRFLQSQGLRPVRKRTLFSTALSKTKIKGASYGHR